MGLRREHGSAYKVADLFPDAAAAFDDVCEVAAVALPKSKLLSYGKGGLEALAANRRGKYVQYAVTAVHDAELFNDVIARQGVSLRAAHLNASKGGQALAAIDGTARFLATRLNDKEFRCGVAATLCLPQTRAGTTNQCPCGVPDNAATGEHAYVCPRDKARQQQATKGQIALGVLVGSLPALKLVGHAQRGMNRRPLEVSFQYAADHAGLVLAEGAAGRTFDAGFTTPDGTLILVDAKRTALVHKGTLEKVCDPKTGQRHAVEAGDKAKLYSYQKGHHQLRQQALPHFLRDHGHVRQHRQGLRQAHQPRRPHPAPGSGRGRQVVDVDGLRSQAVAVARTCVVLRLLRQVHGHLSVGQSNRPAVFKLPI